MTQMSFDFTPSHPVFADDDSQDYHRLPASEKQLRFAYQLAARQKLALPDTVLADRQKLSDWISTHNQSTASTSRFDHYPSSKQVAFAERIARIKRRAVPNECFKDRTLMSRWIDANR